MAVIRRQSPKMAPKVPPLLYTHALPRVRRRSLFSLPYKCHSSVTAEADRSLSLSTSQLIDSSISDILGLPSPGFKAASPSFLKILLQAIPSQNPVSTLDNLKPHKEDP